MTAHPCPEDCQYRTDAEPGCTQYDPAKLRGECGLYHHGKAEEKRVMDEAKAAARRKTTAIRMHYSPERKERIVRQLIDPNGPSVTELARELSIPSMTLYAWKKRAMEAKKEAAMDTVPLEKSSGGNDKIKRLASELMELCRALLEATEG